RIAAGRWWGSRDRREERAFGRSLGRPDELANLEVRARGRIRALVDRRLGVAAGAVRSALDGLDTAVERDAVGRGTAEPVQAMIAVKAPARFGILDEAARDRGVAARLFDPPAGLDAHGIGAAAGQLRDDERADEQKAGRMPERHDSSVASLVRPPQLGCPPAGTGRAGLPRPRLRGRTGAQDSAPWL